MLGQWHAGSQLEALALSMHTKVWVSHKGPGWCLALTHLQKPGLAASAVPGLWRVRGLKGYRRKGEQGGGQESRQLASGNANTCGAKASVIFRGSVVSVRAIGFFRDKKCWVCVQSRSPGNHNFSGCVIATGSPCFFSLLLPISIYLSFASLWVE